MTIKNFTFFSPNGTEFPVGSNNDGKLYMMLTGMDYGTIRRKDWTSPLNTALNVQYTNTSIIAGGRYFELLDETVALKGNSVNYIHANIDLTQTTHPVSLSAETINNSNHVDLNNSSGVLKVLIDIRTTDGLGVISSEIPKQITTLDELATKTAKIEDLTVKGDIKGWTSVSMQNVASATLQYKKINGVICLRGSGNWGAFRTNSTKVVGSLPPEVRPTDNIQFEMTTQRANNNNKPMELQIDTNGTISVWSYSAGSGNYGGVVGTYFQ